MAAGVYEILNTINGKRYIGSAVSFSGRWKVHRHALRHNKHHSPKLQNAWNRYGEAAFQFNKLLICSRDNRLLYEQLCLAALLPKYNIALIAGAPMEGRKHSLKTRALISALHRGNTYNLGKHPSDETRVKLRARQKGCKHTVERTEKIAAANRGKKRTPEAKQRMVLAHSKRGIVSPETKEKMSVAHVGKPWSALRRARYETRKLSQEKTQ